MVTIRPVQSKRDMKRFIDFVYTHYKNATHFVAPLRMDQSETLNPKKNPFFEHGKVQCFLAEDSSGKIIGRIAGIINGSYLEKYKNGQGAFGFFECVEDYAVAEALFQAVEKWLHEQGCNGGMHGPLNPTINDVAGLLVDGFDRRPSIMMPYNFAYYEAYLLQFGFKRVMTMWAYYGHTKYAYAKDLSRLERGIALLYKRYPTLKLRTLDMKNFDRDARIVLDIYNDAWSNNWGSVPMTDNEFKHLASFLKLIVDPRVVFFLELDGKPIAFSITLPDLNEVLRYVPDGSLIKALPLILRNRRPGKGSMIHTGRTLLMGVKKEFQGRGFDSIVNHAITAHAEENGYDASEMSWLLDSNKPMVNAAINLGAVKDKEYAMFEKLF
jgi:hypothetical protein